ncbi:5911_t:CDS:2 [Cetraspora pellucida]|uniref:5911_t:CDS:1 n=1 Tax=Cetraspora pellucida TaxID=1433469 RepID=A0A9N9CDB2_9GLOM|nr:5911_t:CDS:2 [Cetraspora pellucida]
MPVLPDEIVNALPISKTTDQPTDNQIELNINTDKNNRLYNELLDITNADN